MSASATLAGFPAAQHNVSSKTLVKSPPAPDDASRSQHLDELLPRMAKLSATRALMKPANLLVAVGALGCCLLVSGVAAAQPAASTVGKGVKPEGPATPEMLAAMNRLNEAGRVPGRSGSLTFFRWNGAKPPALAHLGLWGPKIDNDLLALTATMPALEVVSLYETSVTDEGLRALAMLPKLRSLAVLPIERYEKAGFGPPQWSYPFMERRAGRPRLTEQALRHLAGVTTLETLELLDADVHSADLAVLKSWPKLGALALPNVVDEETVRHLQVCRRLSQLTLGGRDITAKELEHLAGWRGLKKLTLTHARLAGETLAALARLETVQTVELIACGLTDDDLRHLRLPPQLTELDLPRNEINGPGLAHLAQTKVKALGLEFNNVRDDTLLHLPQLVNVEQLGLSYCVGVTDRGLQSGALQRMPQLKRLALRGLKQVTDASLEELAKLTQLEHINIHQNGITEAGCERLRQALPKAVVFK